MKQYTVMLTTQASNQILEYASYIQNELLNPQAARKFVKDLREAIAGLDTMPQRHPQLEEESWRSQGVRKMIVRGYLVYFWINEQTAVVHVVAVIYGRRDQFAQLLKMDL
mgnify:FL=1